MRRGPYKGRQIEYEKARELREEGWGYHTIAKQMGISVGTVISWTRDMPSDRMVALRLATEARKKRTPSGALATKNAIKAALIRERGHRCQGCQGETWLGKPIPLELHRLDAGKPYSQSPLELLCPNCHTLTPTWGNRKRGSVG